MYLHVSGSHFLQTEMLVQQCVARGDSSAPLLRVELYLSLLCLQCSAVLSTHLQKHMGETELSNAEKKINNSSMLTEGAKPAQPEQWGRSLWGWQCTQGHTLPTQGTLDVVLTAAAAGTCPYKLLWVTTRASFFPPPAKFATCKKD